MRASAFPLCSHCLSAKGTCLSVVLPPLPLCEWQLALLPRGPSHCTSVLRCDGIWDEMSSEVAVKTVAELIVKHEADPSANIADLFIEETLKVQKRSHGRFMAVSLFCG